MRLHDDLLVVSDRTCGFGACQRPRPLFARYSIAVFFLFSGAIARVKLSAHKSEAHLKH